jgi:hypothetical protein
MATLVAPGAATTDIYDAVATEVASGDFLRTTTHHDKEAQ